MLAEQKTFSVDLKNGKKLGRIVLWCFIALLAVILVSTCWFTVDEKEQGVVTTFGKATRVVEAGIHFKLPFGIENVKKVEVNVFHKIELGYRTDSNGNVISTVDDESKMITGDYNIVNVDFFVEYRITDPVKYLYNSEKPVVILTNLIQSQVRNVIGSSDVDSVLTTGKNEIQAKVKELVIQELTEYDIGIALYDVKIQDSDPPTTEVIEAFKEVKTSQQKAETLINEAKAYQNAQIPKAQADADKLLRNAEYTKTARINDAVKQIAMFDAMYNEYALNPEITRTRMYYEMLSTVLPELKVYIDASDGSTEKLLPLEDFSGSGN